MALKGWFKGGKREAGDDGELSIEDLIVLERYEDAEARLKARLKANPQDLHSHLKLAEVFTQLRRGAEAIDEYLFVADEYARDGFYDKGIALLSKAHRLAPLEDSLPVKIEGFKLLKRLETKRAAALEGLRQNAVAGATGALELQKVWHRLARGSLIQGLAVDQIRRLFAGLKVDRRPEGSELAVEGSLGDALHLIGQGVVGARAARKDGEMMDLRTFSAGDIVGEQVLFERRPWPATYHVIEDALLLTLSRDGLERVLIGNPDPQGLLKALRWQGNDRDVANMVMKVRSRN